MSPRTVCMGGVLPLLLALGLTGCGEKSVEDQLLKADEVLRDARQDVQAAREVVAHAQESVQQAHSELELARQNLAEAEARLVEAESQVDLQATDALLFRGIQRKLLDEKRLEDLAIRVDVNRGVVTLYGTVPDRDARDAALEVAKSFPGVVSVEDRLVIPEGI